MRSINKPYLELPANRKWDIVVYLIAFGTYPESTGPGSRFTCFGLSTHGRIPGAGSTIEGQLQHVPFVCPPVAGNLGYLYIM